jgi:hypothetical protein
MTAVFLAGAAIAAGTAALVLFSMPGGRLPRPAAVPGEEPEAVARPA